MKLYLLSLHNLSVFTGVNPAKRSIVGHGVGVATPTASGGTFFTLFIFSQFFFSFFFFSFLFLSLFYLFYLFGSITYTRIASGRVVMDRTYYVQEMRARIGEMTSEINKMNKEIETFETVPSFFHLFYMFLLLKITPSCHPLTLTISCILSPPVVFFPPLLLSFSPLLLADYTSDFFLGKCTSFPAGEAKASADASS